MANNQLETAPTTVVLIMTAFATVDYALRALKAGAYDFVRKPFDPDDLARKISEVLHGDYRWSALRSSALSRHADRFSDAAMAAGVAAWTSGMQRPFHAA